MTEEMFKKADKLYKEIGEYKKILKAFDSCYENIIRLKDYDGNREKTELVMLSKEPELREQIREYFVHKLEVLEREFAEITDS